MTLERYKREVRITETIWSCTFILVSMAQPGFEVQGLAATDSTGILTPIKFNRREPTEQDVVIKILYCGICHTDLHQIKNDWKDFWPSQYPLVPGHEITGVVTGVGDGVTKFKTGDRVGVGCLLDSCRDCEACRGGLEQYCYKIAFTGTHNYGGFSTHIVVDESFVISIPDILPLDLAAPLLCAGITVYTSMKYYGMTSPGKSLGVVGLGGLGHIAVKFGKAFGMKVTVISTSSKKKDDAKKALLADEFIVSTDTQQMTAFADSMDYIVNTVAAPHSLDPLFSLLKLSGKMVVLGVTGKSFEVNPFSLLRRKAVGSSMTGSIQETQEMLNFCSEHNVTPMIEKVDMKSINQTFKRLEKSEVKYRFVVDVAGSETPEI